jgi:hypothetical protein
LGYACGAKQAPRGCHGCVDKPTIGFDGEVPS